MKVETISIGLGYTAAVTSDGGIGLAYTFLEGKTSCSVAPPDIDVEGRPASALLEKLTSAVPIERSVALALVNALNHASALLLPDDTDNRLLFEKLAIREGSQVAMVGYFGPLVRRIESLNAQVHVIDEHRQIGSQVTLKEKLGHWADVLIMTSTTLLNQTTEDILACAGPDVKSVLIGPSTPLVAEAFEHLPIQMLAGTVPVNRDGVLKCVRHGQGTPALQKFGKKKYWTSL